MCRIAGRRLYASPRFSVRETQYGLDGSLRGVWTPRLHRVPFLGFCCRRDVPVPREKTFFFLPLQGFVWVPPRGCVWPLGTLSVRRSAWHAFCTAGLCRGEGGKMGEGTLSTRVPPTRQSAPVSASLAISPLHLGNCKTRCQKACQAERRTAPIPDPDARLTARDWGHPHDTLKSLLPLLFDRESWRAI